jgi:hypothetical protein
VPCCRPPGSNGARRPIARFAGTGCAEGQIGGQDRVLAVVDDLPAASTPLSPNSTTAVRLAGGGSQRHSSRQVNPPSFWSPSPSNSASP